MERLIGKQAPYFSMEALSADGEHFVRVALPGLMGVDAVRAHAEQLRSGRTEGLPVL